MEEEEEKEEEGVPTCQFCMIQKSVPFLIFHRFRSGLW